MLKGICLSFFLILGWVLAQILIFQLFRPQKKFQVYTVLFLTTLPIYAALYWRMPPSAGFLGFFNGLFWHFLFYATYVECLNYVDRPVTLRMLIEFLKAPEGILTLKTLQSHYGLPDMIRKRLEDMRINGYLKQEGDRYFLTPRGRRVAGVFRFIRSLLSVRYYLEEVLK